MYANCILKQQMIFYLNTGKIMKNNYSEYEKMIIGEEYIEDSSLFQMLLENKKLMDEYNRCNTVDIDKRKEILKKLFGEIDKSVDILPPFTCDYGNHIKIGKHSFINHNCTILAQAKVNIGNYVRIAPNVSIYTVGHNEHPEKRKAGYCYAKEVNIEDNVWIGGNVIILPGVTIGENSIIGAGSVVNKDIPSDVITAGNPCKIIRKIKK